MPGFKKSELDALGFLRPSAAPARPSAKTIALANERRVLAALADWGALKTEAVAALCFPAPRYSQGLHLAQRKLKALAAAKLILARLDVHGSRSWILSSAGATAVGATDGYALSVCGGTYNHNSLTARYLISKQVSQGYACYSEYAIAHNRAPFRTADLRKALGKIPDGILLAQAPAAPARLFALETEVAFKPMSVISKQLGTLAALNQSVRADLPHVFSGLIVLMPAHMEWHADRLASAARQRWAQCARPQELADHVLIARAELGAGWTFKGVSESILQL